jgi:branched-chain amino acid transport system substrate-binding protein
MWNLSGVRRLAALGVASVSVAAFSVGPAGAAEPIRIGSVISATGPASFLGDPEQKTLVAYVKRVNAAGGVIGRTIELTIYDDGSDAAKANALVKRLLAQDNVDIVIGASTTGSTMAMAPLAQAARKPMISLAGASVIVEPVKPYIYKVPHSDRMAAQKVLDDIKARGLKSFALLSDTGGFGKSGHAETLKIAAALGLKITADEFYGERDTDMTPQLTKIKASTPQAVFVFGTGQAPALATRNYRQLGMTAPLYMSHGQASTEFLRIAGTAAEGVRLPSPALLIAADLSANDPQRVVSLAYKQAYETQYKSDVSPFGGYAYDGLMMALDAIKRANSTDGETVRVALEQTKQFVGVSGIYTMSPADHMGLTASAFRMVEVQNGKFKEIR